MTTAEDVDRWLAANMREDYEFRTVCLVFGDSEDETVEGRQRLRDLFTITRAVSLAYTGWTIGTMNIPLHLNTTGWMVYGYREKEPITAKTDKSRV